MKRHIVYIFCLCLSLSFLSNQVFAQVDPLYSQYMFNPTVINPAFSGIYDMASITAGYRSQWTSIEGAPVTYSLNAHSSLPINRMGAGLTLVRETAGANVNTDINAAFSYNLDMGYSKLAMAVNGGVFHHKLDRSNLTFQDGSEGDAAFNYDKSIYPNFGFGLLYNSKRLFVSFSVPKILSIDQEVQNASTLEKSSVSIYRPHYYFSTGYLFYLKNRAKFRPSILVKQTEGAPLSIDLNASLLYHDAIWFGLSFRNFNSITIMAQVVLKDKLRIGVAVDQPIRGTIARKTAPFGTFELMMNYNIALFDAQAVQVMYY